eukprot:gene18055-biopygen35736
MRSRARVFARATGRQLYWSIARDWLSGTATRRAWADRMDGLRDQKLGWLGMDDMMTGRRLGCLPLCVGMPVRLSDHLNRPLGLVTGVRGHVREIWFDGAPPKQRNDDGDYFCERPPLAVVVDFHGFAEPVVVGRSCKRWDLRKGTATSVRRLQVPLLPDWASTAHLAQGATLPSVLVDLCPLVSSGESTAAYIALSRVRRLQDLHILRDFDATRLRRGGTKASVDILLHRLRGTLSDATERKRCVRCRTMLPRRAFIDEKLVNPARRWLSGMHATSIFVAQAGGQLGRSSKFSEEVCIYGVDCGWVP